jgi:hypothetical protein
MRRIVLAIAALAVLAMSSRAPAGLALIKRVGPHFRVLCHFDDGPSADAALETAEAIWPRAAALYGLPDAPLDPPLDVHLYRRAEDYLATERELAGGKFDRNLAFSSFDTTSSYVPVQPELTDDALASVGLTAQTRHNVAHEATHLVSYRATPNFRVFPQWATEGAAIWIESETTAARGWSAGFGEDPFVSADMVLAQKLLAGGKLPSATQILRGETKDIDLYERYAAQALLFRRLMSRNDGAAFRKAFLDAVRIPERPDFAERFFDTVVAAYPAEGLAGLDLDYEQFVRSQAPGWDEVFRALSTAGDAWTQAAFADHNAVAWRTSPVGAESYEVRGQIEILPGLGKTQQMNLLLARDKERGFVSVAFVAGYGVNVFRYHAKEDRWETLAAVPAKGIQVWRRMPFRVSVDGSKLTVRVDGVEVATADAGDHPMSGAWGLGVQAGAVGVWRGVKAEPAKR